jgi:hypothetical protein
MNNNAGVAAKIPFARETALLDDLIAEVKGFKTAEQYLPWLTAFSDDDFAVWAAYTIAEPNVRGAINEERRARRRVENDRNRSKEKFQEFWLWQEGRKAPTQQRQNTVGSGWCCRVLIAYGFVSPRRWSRGCSAVLQRLQPCIST